MDYTDFLSKRLWLSPGLRSYHTDRSAGYNENNSGIGMEYDLTKNQKLAMGQFLNSLGKESQYAGMAFLGQPFDSIPELRLGGLMGLLSGYPEMRGGAFFPAAAPMLSYEKGPVGFNVIALPKVGNVSPVVAGQMKVRF